MGADDGSSFGGQTQGYDGDAGDDPVVEAERSWSWLEAMAQEVNDCMSMSFLSPGISSCRVCFICQSSTYTAWLRLLYGSLTGFGMGVLVCICTVQIDVIAEIAQSVPWCIEFVRILNISKS